MKVDLRILRAWMAGTVFGSGASVLFSSDPRAQYVFGVCLVGWLLLLLIGQLRGRRRKR